MNPLLELADRVEAAKGSPEDGRLNTEILRALGWASDSLSMSDPTGRRVSHLPDYVSSINAAMTLVPAEWAYIGYRRYADGTVTCDMEVVGIRVSEISADGATPALALTAASLRAIASMGSSGQ